MNSCPFKDKRQNMNSKNSKNELCSKEQLDKFLNKICIWNLSFMERPLSGKLIEVNKNYFLIEMRDGRTLCARRDCINGFGMTRKQEQAI